MPSFLNDVWEWLYHAEKARKAAERLTDPDAKKAMLELGRYYDWLARDVIAGARAEQGDFAMGARSDPPS
jgi:hypothetical protein